MSPGPEAHRKAPAVVVEEAEELLGNDEAPANRRTGRPCKLSTTVYHDLLLEYVAIVSLVYGVNQGVGKPASSRHKSTTCLTTWG